jgi:hypothetical protein
MQAAAVKAIAQFREDAGGIWLNLSNQLDGDMARAAGGYATKFTQIRADVATCQKKITDDLRIMEERLGVVSTSVQTSDQDAQVALGPSMESTSIF